MPEAAPRILFIPVSGSFGMGEYARSLAIARAAAQRWPKAVIHFMLSREAPYAAATPFPATLLASSPTFHSAAVVEQLEQFRPQVVIFDNAGRTAQLRAARRIGARIVFISSRRRQRSKAFRLRWMRLIDEHWIAYPRFIAGGLGVIERLKSALLRRPTVRYLDVILSRPARSRPAAGEPADLLARIGCEPGSYVLVVPGGGTGHPGVNDAAAQFAKAGRGLAARAFAGRTVPVIFVGPLVPSGDGAAVPPNWHPVGSLPQAELGELMRHARLVIANGGSTLLQAIACGRACVAVPIAKDQAERAKRCIAAGVAFGAALRAADIERVAASLLDDEPHRRALAERAVALNLSDGIEVALQAMQRLIETPCRT